MTATKVNNVHIAKITAFYLANQKTIIALFVLLITFLAGYSTSEIKNTQTTARHNIDQFSYKSQDVNNLMQQFLKNPTKTNQIQTYNSLVFVYGNWAQRETGQNKEDFISYLSACKNVVKSYSLNSDPARQDKINKMNELYKNLIF